MHSGSFLLLLLMLLFGVIAGVNGVILINKTKPRR